MSCALLAACGNDVGIETGVDATGGSTGLPCDVEAVLAQRCQSCHGSPLAGGAPVRLLTHDDLTRVQNGVIMAQRCVDRMKSAASPMPPAPAASATSGDIATLEAWIAAGMPLGDCGGGDNPFDDPPRCTSGRTWTGGNEESPLMHPGVACIACHQRSFEAPRFTVAGTVYASGHEPDDCDGATSATIEISSGAGVIPLAINSAGNFYSRMAIAFPAHVAVVSGGKRREMSMPAPSGDCNSCHTQAGANGAPGRIALP